MSLLKVVFDFRVLVYAVVFFAMVGLSLCFPYAVSSSRAQDAAPGEEFFELILQIERKREKGKPEVLAKAVLGFQKGFDGYFLPLKDLGQVVGFNNEVDIESGRAEGWYFSPENTFVIDTNEGFYTKLGERYEISANDFMVMDYGGGFGDIYIRFETLNEIWPLEMELDYLKLKAVITTARKLPYETARDREERRQRLLLLQAEGEYGGFKYVENDYRWLSAPVLDLSLGYNFGPAEEEDSGFLNVLGKNDLLGFSADYNFSFDYRDGDLLSPEDIRMTLTRLAYGKETMPLGVRRLSVGDVSAPTSDLVAGSNGGRGVTLSTRPIKRRGTFDEVTVEGVALPGWEIELYNNGELLDFGVVDKNGQYRFDVDLYAGGNAVRILLYGPHGEIEERVEFYRISNLVVPGETEYELALVDTEDSFISFEDDAANRRAITTPVKGFAYSGSVSHGLNRWLSVFATGSRSITRQNGKSKYVTAGADMSLGQAQAKLEAYKELGGGHALDGRFASNILGWNFNLRTALLNDFESNRVGFDNNADTLRAQGRLSRRVSLEGATLGLNLSASHEKQEDEDTTTRYQISKFISNVGSRLGNNLRLNYKDNKLSTVTGILNASQRLTKQMRLRGILNYNVKPDFEISNLNTSLSYRHSKELRGSIDWSRRFINSGNRLRGEVSYDFGSFLGSFDTTWDSEAGTSFGIRATTSLGPYDSDGGYIMTSDRLTGKNAIRAALFMDQDADGVFDEDEMPIEGDYLLFDERKGDTSGPYGLLADVRSGNGDFMTVTFDGENATNPFFATKEEGYVMLLRPGVAQNLEVPIVETGLIDGTAFFENGRPVPGLRLQLVRMDGFVAGEAMTTFDGFYTFQYVKPGDYMVQADPGVEGKVSRQMVRITPDNLFSYGINLEVAQYEPVEMNVAAVKSNYGSILNNLKKLQNTLSGAVNGS